ncbi:NitT/TauT family transport system permease protein [Paenibacillus sp. V4I3]|uniref:ABC transporter permease n=1 Tax=unclassified Paenibacillus TaxID=185978 RepID=UPI00277F157F|nr:MULTISPECIES: ABC transporter permease [unclassified Paenibacillus]MDQ0873357.1 NitT/TauT family transport system permease protein [Paenibacillus sp. V4I3]MDQ0890724.1 NitT/TauT family transport system permease protein [Paenibacillus sp. V4I9]
MASVNAGKALVLREKESFDVALWSLAKLRKLFKNAIVIVALLFVWEVAPRVGLVDRTFFPPISEIAAAWWQLLLAGDLTEHTIASLSRSLSGFTLAILISIPLGLAIGWWKPVSEYLNPLLELLRNTAALAILPVFILLLGLGETSKIAIVLYACTFPLLLNTISGVKNVDPLLIKSARSMGLSPVSLFRKVIIPAATPTIFVGIRQAGAGSILVLVAAEMVGAKSGLGYLIQYTQFSFQITNMYAGIISISVIGLIINYLLVTLEKRLTGWKQTYSE